MSVIYDNWERLVRATIRREELRLSAFRTPTPSDLSLTVSSSSSPSNLLVRDYFTYDQILKATGHFSLSNLILHGRSGDLFHGVLEGGTKVCVKKFYLPEAESFFKSELEFYAKVSHPNFVPLLGHHLESENSKFLVYKHFSNMDLSRLLRNPSKYLDWKTRMKIATGVAQALCFLHHQCEPPLVHRDSEPGTSGALDATLTCAYDVYCYGKVLLELVTGDPGRSSYNHPRHWFENILPYITTDKELFLKVLDPRLVVRMEEHLWVEVWAVAIVAKACLNPEPSKRPQMTNVLEALNAPLPVSVSANMGPHIHQSI